MTRLGAALFGLYSIAESQALVRGRNDGSLSWTPAEETAHRLLTKLYAAPEPTSPPARREVEAQLEKRQMAADICGFVDGDIFSSIGCVDGYECAYEEFASVVGCCPFLGACALISDCYDFTQSSAYMNLPSRSRTSAAFCSGVGFSKCVTYIYSGGVVDGMSAFGCSNANTVHTVFGDATNTLADDEEKTARSTPSIKFGTLGVTPATESTPEATTDESDDDADSESSGSDESSERSSSRKPNTTGKIVGGVVGGVLGVVLLAVGAFFFWRRRKADEEAEAVPPIQEQQPYIPPQYATQQPPLQPSIASSPAFTQYPYPETPVSPMSPPAQPAYPVSFVQPSEASDSPYMSQNGPYQAYNPNATQGTGPGPGQYGPR